jgi:hypothetical protein
LWSWLWLALQQLAVSFWVLVAVHVTEQVRG